MAKQASRPQPVTTLGKKVAPVQRTVKKESNWNTDKSGLLFTRQNFIYMGVGLALVLAGLALMSGGAMPDPNKWEPERIYSFTRITLAPMVMIAGFIVVTMGIFKQEKVVTSTSETSSDAA